MYSMDDKSAIQVTSEVPPPPGITVSRKRHKAGPQGGSLILLLRMDWIVIEWSLNPAPSQGSQGAVR